MQITFALAALAAVAYAAPQGVTADITPTAAAPAGCATSYSGTFQITAVNFTTSTKREVEKRDCGAAGSLTLTLAGGQLTDAKGRTGYIASNDQFQFDSPPQTGAIYTGGFSACSNGSLALGGSAVFYECYSGGFYNLYDASQGAQCYAILIDILPCSSSDPAVGVSTDGQATGTAVVTQISDAQPQVATALPISQLSDGQPQIPTAKTTATPACQISDGQVQAGCTTLTTTGAPISQISDGQIQASKTSATTAAPISQISDGQIQASKTSATTAAPISQISDGQIQASKTSAAPISQISDGQIQAGNATTSSKPAQFTGAASSVAIGSQFAGLVVAVVAVGLL